VLLLPISDIFFAQVSVTRLQLCTAFSKRVLAGSLSCSWFIAAKQKKNHAVSLPFETIADEQALQDKLMRRMNVRAAYSR